MLKPILVFFTLIILLNKANGQEKQDSSFMQLPEITVKAYEQNRNLKEVPAPVYVIDTRQLGRYSNTTLLPAINAAPGVRMEERSPGSYRLNIRGSSLRAPFGVRNVKIYLNDIPFTDPGGGSYLNQLSFFDIDGIEIIKGPGSSLYGAGTGGVMLLNTMNDSSKNKLLANYSTGSFNTHNLNISASGGNNQFRNKVSYTHQKSDGYRNQSAMRRDLISWQANVVSNDRQSISTHIMYGNLYYQTPGGLTKTQFQNNPKAARQATPIFPGAEDINAAIYQTTFRAGIQQIYQFNSHFENKSSVYGAFSQIKNSAILNYERRAEPHFGGRTTFGYTSDISGAQLKIIAGAEFQQGYFSIMVHKNAGGNPDSLRTEDEVNNRQLSLFTQATITFPSGWIAGAGISFNKTSLNFNRLSIVPAFNYTTSFNNEWSPRISLLKKLSGKLSLYGVVSKGFSPPTVSELLPSTTVINTSLEAEQGINYEAGLKGSFLQRRLQVDVSAFNFGLKNAITQRRDDSGADYFINAGNTRQNGIEGAFSYQIIRNDDNFINSAVVWVNYTYFHFRYKDFKQGGNDFSGNRIPGVAPNTLAGGLDIVTKPGAYLHLTYFYSDHIALNDSNSEYASSYHLPGFRAGFKRQWGRHFMTDIFIAGDNLQDERYSLGNDINAAGNRYYNSAAGRNFQVGIGVQCW